MGATVCGELKVVSVEARPSWRADINTGCCLPERVRPLALSRPAAPAIGKGLNIWADSMEGLLKQLPFELDADLDHLYALPEAAADTAVPPEMPYFPRDVAGRLQQQQEGGQLASAGSSNKDNFACVQVDDAINPFGLCAVAAGLGQDGHLVSSLLLHELPGLLVQNPRILVDPDMALYQAFVAVAEMSSNCHYLDPSATRGSSLAATFLKEGVLHIAWTGEAKAVLGRRNAPAAEEQNLRAVELTRGDSSAVQVRRLRLRPDEDVLLLLGTPAFWTAVSPQNAVTLAGRHLPCTASFIADALMDQCCKRAPASGSAVVVMCLGGNSSGQEPPLLFQDGCCAPLGRAKKV